MFFWCSPPFSKSHKTGCSCPTALKCRRSLRHTDLSGLSPRECLWSNSRIQTLCCPPAWWPQQSGIKTGLLFLAYPSHWCLGKVTRACSTVFFAQNEQKHFRDSSTCYNWKKNTCHFHPTSCLPSLSGPSGNIWIRMIPQLLRQGCVSFPNRKVIRAVERKFKHVQRKSHCMLRASWIRFIYWKEESSHRSAHASKSTQHFPKMAFV